MENLILNSAINSSANDSINTPLFLTQLQALTRSKKLLIAYSGGLDSHVLLHLASALSKAENYDVRALHVHHGLQQAADDWVNHCQKTCDELNIPLEVDYLNLNLSIEKGLSIEELARTFRYSALDKSLQAGEVLLTAHHQNDQAETLLLQLFRGAGVQGLASMPLISNFGLGQHARPLLPESRQGLEHYAQVNELRHIEDPSNKNSAFDRNFLRNEIIPQLRARWPSIDKTISRSAGIQAETKYLLDDLAQQDLASLQSNSDQGDYLAFAGLEKLSLPRQRLLIRYWITTNGFNPPSERKLKHLFSDVIHASEDAQPVLEWQGVEIRRYQGKLYIMKPLQDHDNKQVLGWTNPLSSLDIPSLGLTLPALLSSQYDDKFPVTIRFRKGGEKIHKRNHKANSSMRISLKNFMNESGIPPWLRSRIPLIYSGENLIKVMGFELE